MLQLAHTYEFELMKAKKAGEAGIAVMTDMLAPGPDGRPGFYVVETCVDGIAEAEQYCWGEGRGDSELPTGQVDHAMDTWRYLAMGARSYAA